MVVMTVMTTTFTSAINLGDQLQVTMTITHPKHP